MMCIEDCLSLLDGRLNQLNTLFVEIHRISPSTNGLEDTVKSSNRRKLVRLNRQKYN